MHKKFRLTKHFEFYIEFYLFMKKRKKKKEVIKCRIRESYIKYYYYYI